MYKVKTILPTAAMMVAIAFSSATSVYAARYSVAAGGGTWNYGVGVTGSYSDYLHNSKRHSATVKHNKDASSQTMGKGIWAKSRLSSYSGCSFYWNVL